MLDIKFIRENQDLVKKAIKDKAVDLDLDALLKIDEERRKFITEIDILGQKRKQASKARNVEEGRKLKEELGKLEKDLLEWEKQFQELMLLVPNIPSADTPIGGEKDFRVIDEWGEKPKFSFPIKDHIALGIALDILDLERGAKVAGFRGYFLKNEGVLLHLGILQLALKKLIERGFTPMIPPTLVGESSLIGSGHFPTQRQEIYEVEEYREEKAKATKFLTGTAEPSLLAYSENEVLEEKDLPIKLGGISQCYRREVGGYGKDTKGIYRIHEFMKVEQVVLCKDDLEESEKLFQELNSYARELLQELELPHRVIQIATGDMGSGKYKMYDIETWMPGRGNYGETHSNSNLTDWQARRLNIRYRTKSGQVRHVYTLNNTMIASPRTLIPILENYQEADGSVRVPKVLQEFVGKDRLKPK
jgi:seryl-tRNA synthetase